MSLRVAADVGGTFTDIAIEDGTQRWSVKVPTTHDAPERGVLEGVGKGLAEAGRPLSDVSLVVHGTTPATNALIGRKGARTALLTTEGFRDVLEMGNEGRFDQYDIRAMKPLPLIPRHLRCTVRERLRHDGSVVEPLDERGLLAAAGRMRDAGVEAVAIAFLHAYADGSHDQDVGHGLARCRPHGSDESGVAVAQHNHFAPGQPTLRPQRVADRAWPACRHVRRDGEVPCRSPLGLDAPDSHFEVPGLVARHGPDMGAVERDDHRGAPGKAHAVRAGAIARLQAVGRPGQPAPHARVVGRGACREQQAHDAGRLAEREPGAQLCLHADKLRRRASAQERTHAAWSVGLVSPTAARTPARLPDGDPPEQSGDRAAAAVMQDALRPAAAAGPVKGAGLADLVLHEAQLQPMQQVLGFGKTKAEVGRVGR